MPRARLVAGALFVVWGLACLGGFGLLWRYKTRPGDPGEPPARWPDDVALARSERAATLLMIAHPLCPCTRASLGELEVVMRRAPRDVAAYVVFAIPEGVGPDWERGELHDRARAIPRVQVIDDHQGVLSRRLRVSVSGHVLVYGADGALRFSGGITGSRGHAGDNAGRARVLAILGGDQADHDTAYVFGCSIKEPS